MCAHKSRGRVVQCRTGELSRVSADTARYRPDTTGCSVRIQSLAQAIRKRCSCCSCQRSLSLMFERQLEALSALIFNCLFSKEQISHFWSDCKTASNGRMHTRIRTIYLAATANHGRLIKIYLINWAYPILALQTCTRNVEEMNNRKREDILHSQTRRGHLVSAIWRLTPPVTQFLWGQQEQRSPGA